MRKLFYMGLLFIVPSVDVLAGEEEKIGCTVLGNFNLSSPSVTDIYQTSIDLSWGTCTGAQDYLVEYKRSNTTNWITLYVGNETSFMLTGLTAGLTYDVKIRGHRWCDESFEPYDMYKDSNTITNILLEPATPSTQPPDPISATGFIAKWSTATGAASYRLDVATNSSFTSFVSGYNNYSLTTTSKQITGLTAGDTYYYRVRAVNASGTSPSSSYRTVSTTPPGPSGLSITSVGQNSFSLNWTATNGATSYRVDVSTNSSFSNLVKNDVFISGGSTTSYAVTSLSPGTLYYCRLRAVNGGGTSGSSSSVNSTTIPATPTTLSAADNNGSSFTAKWNAVTGATSYRLDVASDNSFSNKLNGYDNLLVSGTSQPVSGLDEATVYYYRVRAVNLAGTSGSSGGRPGITTPPVPSILPATGVGQTAFTANWETAPGATVYLLDVSSSVSFSTFVEGYERRQVTEISEEVTGLSSGTTYHYRVKAAVIEDTESASSGYSSAASALTIPAEPGMLSGGSFGQSFFTISWPGVTGAASYLLDVATDAAFESVLSGYTGLEVTGTSQAVAGLTPGTHYYFRLRAKNVTGTSGTSATGTSITIPAEPGTVTPSDITQTSFTLSWTDVAGATGYRLDVASDSEFSQILAGYSNLSAGGTSQEVTGLAEGTTYYYRIRAENASGVSGDSPIGNTITRPPNPETPAVSGIIQSEFTLSWSAVTGATGYRLDVATDNSFESVLGSYSDLVADGTSQTVSGLTAGTSYYFRLRAVNINGASGNSTTGSTITVPAIPGTLSASSITQSSFVLSWSGITGTSGYRLDVATDNSFSELLASYSNLFVSATSATVSGLAEGATYYYRLRSQNTSGVSGNSSTGNTITLPADPVVPVAGAISQSSFTLNWSGVAGATHYRLDVATDNGFSAILAGYNNLSVTGTQQVINTLTTGTVYYYRLRAENVNGSSGNSETASTITVPAKPGTVNAGAISQTGFTLSWSAVTGAAGYRLDVAESNSFSPVLASYDNLLVTGTNQSVSGLTSGQTYYFRLRAENANGVSPNSSTGSTITVPAEPATVSAADNTATSFTAKWNAVTGATGYKLDVATDNGFSAKVAGYDNLTVATTSQSVTGLTGGTVYYYRVLAENGNGVSGFSDVRKGITAPPVPTASAATLVEQTSFTANWNTSAGATHYILDVATDSEFNDIISGYGDLQLPGTSQSVSGLSEGTTFYYRVKAALVDGSESGSSAYSTAIGATTKPANPGTISVSEAAISSFTLSWDGVTGAETYRLDVASDQLFNSILPSYSNLPVEGTTQAVTGLDEGTLYYFRLRAVNTSGSSGSSLTYSGVTLPVAPDAPAIDPADQTSFTVSWAGVSGAAGYRLDVATDHLFSAILASYSNLLVSSTSKEVAGLSPGITYYVRVRAENTSGPSAHSPATSKITVPAPPNTLAADENENDAFTARWSASAGATGYRLDVATDDQFSSLLPSYTNLAVSGTSRPVTGLDGATLYYYRLKAENASGLSGFSNVQSAATKPPAPVVSAATAIGQTSFTANWSASTGATHYLLDVATDDGFTEIVAGYENLAVSAIEYEVTGLEPGKTYYYRLRSAILEGEPGAASDYSLGISALTIPAEPGEISAGNVAENSLGLSWAALSGAEEYRLDVATDNLFGSVLPAYANLPVTGTSQTVSGLAAATNYYFRLRAVNVSGASGNSGTYSTITLTQRPGAPAVDQLTRSSFVVSWPAVEGANSYRMDIATDNLFNEILTDYQNLSIAGTSAIADGLSAGTRYYIRLRSENTSGSSANSPTKGTITVPAEPGTLNASPVTQSSFVINWPAVEGAVSYRLDVAADDAFETLIEEYSNLLVNALSQSVSGLQPGTPYFYRLRSVNSSGTSDNSATFDLTTIPPDPTSVAAGNVTGSSFALSWGVSAGAASYELDVATDASFESMLAGYSGLAVSGTSQTISDLAPGTQFYYRLRAVNAGGTSNNSSVGSIATIPAAPGVPLASNETHGSFHIDWVEVAGATNYRLDVATTNTFGALLNDYSNLLVNGTSKIINGLEPGTTYFYRVRAENASGTSANSETGSTFTIPANPGVVLAQQQTQESFSLSWDEVPGAANYRLDVSADNSFSVVLINYADLLVNGTTQMVTGLDAGTAYYFRLRAANSKGASANSTVASTVTVPANPAAISVSNVGQSAITLQWAAVSGATAYRLDVATDNSFETVLSSYSNLVVGGTDKVVDGLSPGTSYYYRLRAENSSGVSGNSLSGSTITIPAEPGTLSATSNASTSFTANWGAVAGATGYRLDVAADQQFLTMIDGYSDVPVTGNAKAVEGLSAGRIYYYRVRSENSSGISISSDIRPAITKPVSPAGLAVDAVNQTTCFLRWDGVADATQYKIEMAYDAEFSQPVEGYNDVRVTTNLHEATGMTPGTIHYVRISAEIVEGSEMVSSDYSSLVSVLTSPGSPAIPAAGGFSQTSFVLSWAAVVGAGSYRLDVATDDLFNAKLSGYSDLLVSGTNQVINSLEAGTLYYFRLRAENTSGVSDNSPAGAGITIPAAPEETSFSDVGQTTFTASWPEVAGATGYRLDLALDNEFTQPVSGYSDVVVNGASTQIENLAGGTIYYVRVRSQNTSGISGSSAISSQLTIPVNPGQPVAGSFSQSTFTLSWNTVASASGYRFDVATDLSFSNILAGYGNVATTAPTAEAGGLAAGETYYARVRAVNASGASGNSTAVTVITVPPAPAAPAVISESETSFVLNWELALGATTFRLDVASNQSFDSMVDGYSDLEITGTSREVTGLAGGKIYYCRLRAVNASGTSGNSPVQIALTRPAAPALSQPSNITSASFAFGWSLAGGATEYRVDVATNPSMSARLPEYDDMVVADTFLEVSGLDAFTTYYYVVRAVNASGASVNPVPLAVQTAPLPPQPSAASNITQTSFTANWFLTTGATGYRLEVAESSDFVSSPKILDNIAPTESSVGVSGLVAGQNYYYRLTAYNGPGMSGYSGSVAVSTIPPRPAEPRIDEATQSSLVVSWNEVKGAAKYHVEIAETEDFSTGKLQFQNIQARSLEIEALGKGKTYFLRISAENSGGISPFSKTTTATTVPSNPAQGLRSGTPQADGFTCEWDEVAGAEFYELDLSESSSFEVLIEGYNAKPIFATEEVVRGLQPNTKYYWRVRSANSFGVSGNSVIKEVGTSGVDGNNNFEVAASDPVYDALYDGTTSEIKIDVRAHFYPVSATLYYRPGRQQAFLAEELTLEGLPNQTKNVQWTLQPQWIDELGMEFYIEFKDAADQLAETPKRLIRVKIAESQIAPGKHGGKIEDYVIISVPFDFPTDKPIEDLMEVMLGKYDKREWRLLRYENKKLLDYDKDGLRKSSFKRGAGYWFNSKEAVELNFGETYSPQYTHSAPFVMKLKQGWNLIGNPYNFDVSWSDVLEFNGDPEVVGSLMVYQPSGGQNFKESDLLKAFGGGFVYADADVNLQIPLSGVESSEGAAAGRFMHAATPKVPYHWILPVSVKKGNFASLVGGFGMHESASAEKDRFDRVVLPRFGNYLELYTPHPGFRNENFSLDVVDVHDKYEWSFTVAHNGNKERVELFWDNEQISGQGLFILHNLQTGQLTDMRASSSHSVSSNPASFKLYYWESNHFNWLHNINLHTPYPNPAADHVVFPVDFALHDLMPTEAELVVMDLSGREVARTVKTIGGLGIRNITWDCADTTGRRLQAGIYITEINYVDQSNHRHSVRERLIITH